MDPIGGPPDAPLQDALRDNSLDLPVLENAEEVDDSSKNNERKLPPNKLRPTTLRYVIPQEFFGDITLPPKEVICDPAEIIDRPRWDDQNKYNFKFPSLSPEPPFFYSGTDWTRKVATNQFYNLQRELPPEHRSPVFETLKQVLSVNNKDNFSISRSGDRGER